MRKAHVPRRQTQHGCEDHHSCRAWRSAESAFLSPWEQPGAHQGACAQGVTGAEHDGRNRPAPDRANQQAGPRRLLAEIAASPALTVQLARRARGSAEGVSRAARTHELRRQPTLRSRSTKRIRSTTRAPLAPCRGARCAHTALRGLIDSLEELVGRVGHVLAEGVIALRLRGHFCAPKCLLGYSAFSAAPLLRCSRPHRLCVRPSACGSKASFLVRRTQEGPRVTKHQKTVSLRTTTGEDAGIGNLGLPAATPGTTLDDGWDRAPGCTRRACSCVFV